MKSILLYIFLEIVSRTTVNPQQSANPLRNSLFRSPFRRARPTTVSLIQKNGYPVEVHHVLTKDGYILELHRIPFGIESPENSGKKIPVIIQHGNFQSSADWVINKPSNNCLPFILADKGYDVWLGNQRGNTYSNKHAQFSIRSPKFWNFSYHEMAEYDVPATIDYVLDTTESNKLQYISHSVGGKNFIAAMSLHPEYNEKVGIGITMGPAGFMSHMFNGIGRLINPLLRQGQLILKYVGTIPALPPAVSGAMRSALPFLCRSRIDIIGICPAFFFSVTGLDREQIDAEKIEAIKSVFPSSTSLKLFMHLVQEIRSGHFRQYDYGREGNLKAYNNPNPPDYELSKVTVPMSILHGNYDHIARVEDTEALVKSLPNVVDYYVIPWEHWTHMDFNYAKDAATLCYNHIVEVLEKYRF